MRLLQWFDSRQRLACASQGPCVCQFVPVQRTPLLNMSQGSHLKAAVDFASVYCNRDLMVTVQSVKVRWRMVALVHRDHDSEEATDFRHKLPTRRGANSSKKRLK